MSTGISINVLFSKPGNLDGQYVIHSNYVGSTLKRYIGAFGSKLLKSLQFFYTLYESNFTLMGGDQKIYYNLLQNVKKCYLI
jgi:hypothetical protein